MARGTVTYRLVADASGVKKGVDEAKTALSSLPASMSGALRAGSNMVDDFANNATSKLGGAGQALAALGPAGLAAGAAISVVGGAFAAATNQAIDFADKIDNLAQRTGFSAASLQQLDYAARLTNTTLEETTSAAAKMQAELAKAPERFDQLGLSAAALRQMAPEQQFYAVARAIAEIDDQAAKMGAVREIFGRSGDAILPLLSRLDELRAAADRAGAGLGDDMMIAAGKADDSIDRLGANFTALKNNVGGLVLVLTPVSEVMGWIADSIARITRELRELHASPTGKLEMLLALPTFGGSLAVGKGIRTFETLRNPVGALPDPLDFRPSFGGIAGPSAAEMAANQAEIDAALRRKVADDKASDAATKLAAAHYKLWAQAANASNFWNEESSRQTAARLADSMLKDFDAREAADVIKIPMGNLGLNNMNLQAPGAYSGGQPGLGSTIAADMKAAFATLPQVIVGAIQGGGNIGGAIGGALGGGLGESLGKSLAPKLSSVLGKTLGGALGAAMPVVGSLIGAGLGKLVGGLFGDGGKKERQDEALKTYLPQLEQLSGQIDQLLKQTMQAGASGLTAVFDHMGKSAELTTDKLARMGAVGYSMFQALRAQGYGTLEAMKLLGPAIDAAAKAALDAGLELTGAFKELADFQKRIGENAGLIAAIDGATAALNALSTSGRLNLADFNTMQAAAADYFKELEDAGFTAAQRLELMAPMLYAIADAAKRYGFELDAATQEQIRLAEEAGLFDDMKSPMEKLVELQGLMLLAISALVKAFGKDLPDAVQAYIDKLNKIPKIPGQPDAPTGPGGGGSDDPDPGKLGRTPGYASGGYIPATPGGRVIRVAEGGEGEWVIPESRMPGGSQALEVTVPVYLDGDLVTTVVARSLERGTAGGRRLERAVRG